MEKEMKEAEIEHVYNTAVEGRWSTVFDGLKAVAMAAVREEREACATIADGFRVNGLRTVVDAVSDAIRMRSNEKLSSKPPTEPKQEK
jgi:uncharacterized protein YqgV (UPF0045/DUF77 family)